MSVTDPSPRAIRNASITRVCRSRSVTDPSPRAIRNYVTSGGAAPQETVAGRIKRIPAIRDVKPLQFFTNTDELLLVQWDETLEAVNGMEVTTVQWEAQGGASVHFRVMAIQLPAIRERYIGESLSTKYASVVHGTTS